MEAPISSTGPHRFYRRWGKRFVDLFLSFFALAALSPVLLPIAFLVRFRFGSPVLFRQQRPGLHGKPFVIYKFRTMNDGRDQDGRLLPDSERLSPLGRYLRLSSLDELPELFNVLKGEMSLVGPRPLLMEYLPRYTQPQARRHEVRPGITGWAQVNGRQNIRFSKRLEYDTWYVDNVNLRLDVKILYYTFLRVITGEGVVSGQDVREVDDLEILEYSDSGKDKNIEKGGKY
jgi:lipopolysaccharide/colanic/teichoic acid biosynthesis glycosyltransferase